MNRSAPGAVATTPFRGRLASGAAQPTARPNSGRAKFPMRFMRRRRHRGLGSRHKARIGTARHFWRSIRTWRCSRSAGRGGRLPYKLSRRRKNFPKLDPGRQLEAVRTEWIGILDSLKGESDIALDTEDVIKTLRHLKAWEDVSDAIVCCWVGLQWLKGRARPYRDKVGAIWVPEGSHISPASCWRAKRGLAHSALLGAYSRRPRSHRRRAGDETR